MNIVVLHGDDIEKSRKRLQKFIDVARTRNWDVLKLSGKSDNLPDTISATSLFGTKRLIIVEEAQQLSKESLTWIEKNSALYDDTVCFYATKTLSVTQLKPLKGAKIEVFEIPNLLWNLLDTFAPQSASTSITLLHNVLESEPVELVFAMIARHMRDLYHIYADEKSFTGPEWRKRKLKSQATKFGELKLKHIIHELAEIDIQSKTSKENLFDLLDFWLIKNLE